MEPDGESSWSVQATKESLTLVTGSGLVFLPVFVWLFFASDSSSLSLFRPFMQPPARYLIAAAGVLLSVNFIRVSVALRRGRPLVNMRDGVVEVQTATRRRRFDASSIASVRSSETGVGLVIDLDDRRHVRVGYQPAGSTWSQVAALLMAR